MKKVKRTVIVVFLVIIILLTGLSLYSYFRIGKSAPVTYVRDLPGSIMATTIPPFGIFIEQKYENEGDGKGSILAHERIHWLQYQERGLWGFHKTYLFGWIQHGRLYNELEYDARRRSR